MNNLLKILKNNYQKIFKSNNNSEIYYKFK